VILSARQGHENEQLPIHSSPFWQVLGAANRFNTEWAFPHQDLGFSTTL